MRTTRTIVIASTVGATLCAGILSAALFSSLERERAASRDAAAIDSVLGCVQATINHKADVLGHGPRVTYDDVYSHLHLSVERELDILKKTLIRSDPHATLVSTYCRN